MAGCAGGGPDQARAPRFDLPPQIQVADRKIGEAHDRGAVSLTVAEILAQSSNVGSVMIGLKMGAKRFDKWVRRFGFGSPTGVGLPGEAGGIVPRPEEYSGSSLGNMPIGQGLAVTPIQMAAAYSALANGGVMRRPARDQGRGRGRPPGGLGTYRRAGLADARRACSRRVAPRRRPTSPATSWRARPAPPRSRTPRRGGLLEVQVLLLVHRLRPRAQAAAAGGGDGRRAQGRATTAPRWPRRRSRRSWSSRSRTCESRPADRPDAPLDSARP